MEGDSVCNALPFATLDISIHSLRMEGDSAFPFPQLVPPYFNPLPPYGGRQQLAVHDAQSLVISIHSLRMEGDFFSLLPHLRRRHFNPLPPYGGRLMYGS